MKKLTSNLKEGINENEDTLIEYLKPEFNRICYNPIRASILHLLMKSRDLGYSLSVEEIATRLGKRHSVIIYHLEKLEEWKVVAVIRKQNYGGKKRRSIWGLNLRYPNLVKAIYLYLLKTFYTVEELEKMCNINRNVR
ncbi:MAG: helix-turn-helix transcriptional regulator [Candidatus Aenigmarchaeota archaeon]|nr:helix-turn-helix transcriptional regulator [Candidatus Aenigmarchaeota archaeon]